MARQNRSGQLQLNFDGLTDSVTNLVGALLILVALLLGITKEIVEGTRPSRSDVTQRQLGGAMSTDELLRQVAELRSEIEATDQQIDYAEQRIEELRDRARPLVGRSRRSPD